MVILAAVLVVLLRLAGAASGQDVVRTVYGGTISAGDRFGSAVALTGDFRDGTYEIAVGVPGCDWLFDDIGCIYLMFWTPDTDTWWIRIVGGLLDPATRDSAAAVPDLTPSGAVLGHYATGSSLRTVGYANSDRLLDTWVAGFDGKTVRAHVSDIVNTLESCDLCATHHLDWHKTNVGADGAAALGDLDGNGVGEYATRDGDTVRVYFHQPSSEPRPQQMRTVRWTVPDSLASGSASAVGDLDGDGHHDLVVSGAGRLGVAYMGDDGLPIRITILDAESGTLPWQIAGEAGFGRVMAPAGDVDQDGTPDLWIGLPEARDGKGSIALFLMRPNGAVRSVVRYDGADISGGLNAGDAFGYAITSLRDPFGEGRSEIVVGSPGADVDGADTGSVHLLSVLPDGTIRARERIDNRFPPISRVTIRLAPVERMPDFDGDGIRDYFAASDEPQWDRDIWEWSGELAIHLAREDGTVRDRIPIHFRLPGFRDDLDRHVLVGGFLPDMDGDGRPELWVTAKENERQGPFPAAILFLDSDGTVRRHRMLPWEDNRAWFLIPVGDESGDGLPDLIGVEMLTQNAYLVRTDTSASEALLETRPLYVDGEFGMWAPTFSPGDLDGDGHADAVSFKHAKPTQVRVVWGRAWSDTTALRPMAQAEIEASGLLHHDDLREAYVLGTVRDLDGDGLREVVVDVWHGDESRAGYLYFLNPDGTGKRTIRLWGPGNNPVTGGGIAMSAWDAGDLTGDGVPEIAIRLRGRIVTISVARLLQEG